MPVAAVVSAASVVPVKSLDTYEHTVTYGGSVPSSADCRSSAGFFTGRHIPALLRDPYYMYSRSVPSLKSNLQCFCFRSLVCYSELLAAGISDTRKKGFPMRWKARGGTVVRDGALFLCRSRSDLLPWYS